MYKVCMIVGACCVLGGFILLLGLILEQQFSAAPPSSARFVANQRHDKSQA